MVLTQVQLNTLSDYVIAAYPVDYYSQLAEYGDRYGVLALGVVLADTLIHDH